MAVKTISKVSGYLMGLVLLSSLFSVSCNKADLDPDFPFTVQVLSIEDSIPLPNVNVEIFAPNPESKVFFEGFTNQNGNISFEHNAKAILVARATRGEAPNFSWIGCNEVRLFPNRQVNVKVYLEPAEDQVIGCSL